MKYWSRVARIGLLAIALLLPAAAQAQAALPEPTDAFYVNDYANVIDAATEALIVQNGSALAALNGAQVVIVTIDFAGERSLSDYAADLFNQWGVGDADQNNGVMLVMSIGDDDYWAVQGRGLESTLTSGMIDSILYDYLEPDFAVQDYDAGAKKVYAAFVRQLGGVWSENAAPGGAGASGAGQESGAGSEAGSGTGGAGNAATSPSPAADADEEDGGNGFLIFILIMIVLLYFIFKRRGGGGQRGRRTHGSYSGTYVGTTGYPRTRTPSNRPSGGGGWFGGGSSSGSGGSNRSGGGSTRGGGGSTRGGGAGRRK